MGMVVRSNIMAVNAQRQLGVNNSQVSKALEKLSSGYRINRAGDDASGLAISEKMKAQIKGLDTASLNAQDGISVVQTAEGALTEVHNMLNRMVELATRSANGINADQNRQALQEEVTALQSEIDRIAQATTFNDIHLLDGTGGSGAAGGATKAEFTAPTADTLASTDGTAGTPATFNFDVAGFAGTAEGDVEIKVGELSLGTVTITKDMTDAEFAAEVAKLPVKVKDENGTEVEFAAAVAAGSGGANTKITFTAKTSAAALKLDGTGTGGNGADLSSNKFSVTAKEPAAAAAAAAAADPAYVKGTTYDFNFTKASQPTATNKITIAGKEFEFAAAATAGKVEIGADIKATINNLAAAMAADTDISKNFDVTAKDGVLTLTAKADAAAGDTAPEIAAATTWADAKDPGKVPAPTVTKPDANNGAAGGAGSTFVLQIGDTAAGYNQLTFTIKSMTAASIGVDATAVDISTLTGAQNAIQTVKTAIDTVSTERAKLGAIQNRLEYTINNLDTTSENMQSANSRIRDTDMAKMMMEYTKVNVVTQSAQAMLAQANQQPQSVLQLLQ